MRLWLMLIWPTNASRQLICCGLRSSLRSMASINSITCGVNLRGLLLAVDLQAFAASCAGPHT